jgi:hypothetical protein
MAKAYTHMAPYKRLVYYTRQRIHELGETIERQEAELKMWYEPLVQDLLFAPDPDGVRVLMGPKFCDKQFLHEFISNIAPKVATSRSYNVIELGYWKEFLKILQPCPRCSGYGELREIICQDESRMQKCDVCQGTGRDLDEIIA